MTANETGRQAMMIPPNCPYREGWLASDAISPSACAGRKRLIVRALREPDSDKHPFFACATCQATDAELRAVNSRPARPAFVGPPEPCQRCRAEFAVKHGRYCRRCARLVQAEAAGRTNRNAIGRRYAAAAAEGDLIAAHLLRTGETYQEMADRLEVTVRTIYAIRRGSHRPGPWLTGRLAAVIECDESAIIARYGMGKRASLRRGRGVRSGSTKDE